MGFCLFNNVAVGAEYLRRRLSEPYSGWDAGHMAKSLLGGLEGDLRVSDDTIVVTGSDTAIHRRGDETGCRSCNRRDHRAKRGRGSYCAGLKPLAWPQDH